MKLIIDISKDRYDEIMAMDWVNGRRFFDEELRAIHDGIPQRTERWIPVSERLPEKDDQYICTVKFKHEDGYQDVETHAVEYIKEYGGWDMDRFFSDCKPRIIAWMELPDPYGGNADESNN